MVPTRRGQTTIDFAIGVSLFLIAVVFVLAFVPGMLEPFEESSSENNVVADRIASDIVEGQLADPDRPFVLHPDCTRAFFEDDDPENTDGDSAYSYGSGCNFDDVSVDERLGAQGLDTDGNEIGTGPNVNVTMLGDFNDVDGGEDDELEVLCVDANSDARIIDAGDPYDDADGSQCDIPGTADDDFLFTVGPPVPEGSDSVASARRVVSLEGKPAIVVVRVWS